MKKEVPRIGSKPDAYEVALKEERRAWEGLHGMPRSDPRYAQALAAWQAAADRIGAEAEKLLKHPRTL